MKQDLMDAKSKSEKAAKGMIIKKARKLIGKRAEKMSDKEIQMLLDHLVILCNKVIDSVVSDKRE